MTYYNSKERSSALEKIKKDQEHVSVENRLLEFKTQRLLAILVETMSLINLF